MTVINTNISANITANSLAKNERAMSQTMERLSTGMRINSASDDAAGLAISERMTSQVKGLDQAARNANDAISMLQTADGAAIEITNMLQRMRELTVQASSATNTAPDIANMDLEFKALASEIDRIVDSTQWNGENILNGEGGDNGSFTFQIGANDGQSVTVDFSDFNLAAGAGATEAVAGVAGVNQVDAVAAVTGVDQVDAVAAVDQVNYSAEVQGVTGSLQVEQADAKGAAAIMGVPAVEGVAATYTQAITDAQAASINSNLVISDGTTSVTVGAADITDLDSIVAAVNDQGLNFEVAKNEAGDGLVMTYQEPGAIASAPTVVAENAAKTALGGSGVSSVTGKAAIEGVRFEAYSAAVDFQAAVETVAYQAEVAFVAGVTEVAEVTGVTAVAGVTGVTGVAEVAEVAAKGAVVMTQNLSGMTATNATLTTTSANMLETLDKAINGVTTQRATFGSVMNRLEYTVDNLANVSQNTSASLSRIADADYAAETTELARTQIIQQAGTAMLSQANQQAQSVLALLK